MSDKRTILIIDDDELNRGNLREFFWGQGYNVLEAEDGHEGIDHMRKQDVVPDVVITDILMPKVDGIEVIVTIRQQHPNVKIIAMSGGGMYVGKSSLNDAKNLGADSIIEKPFRLAEIDSAVNALLNEESS